VYFHRGARQTGLIRDEHKHDPRRGFSGGYLFETMASPPLFIAWFGGWGEDASSWMENYTNMAGVYLVGEDPPQESNRIHLHADDKDENGLPVPVIDYADHPNTIAMRRHALNQTKSIYEALGATDFRSSGDEIAEGCHNMGVARMSADPKDGVTNRWGQTHDIPNLFVSDGSLFSTSAAPNPTLTIVALAIRQADHIAGRMARREL
jgi:choline dehydrogenase-like flavoprotein